MAGLELQRREKLRELAGLELETQGVLRRAAKTTELGRQARTAAARGFAGIGFRRDMTRVPDSPVIAVTGPRGGAYIGGSVTSVMDEVSLTK